MARQQLYIGLMSGTSLDGVDGVVLDFTAHPPRCLAAQGVALPGGLRDALLALNAPGPDELHRAAVAAHQLAHTYAEVVHALLRQSGLAPESISAIGAHGQTVRHHPPGATLRGRTVSIDAPDFPPYTLQLNQPALLAERTGITVVADFRSRDVAAGGQGAPLVPAFHRHLFARPGETVAVVNIGGMANVTGLLADGRLVGFDTGPGNVLLDLWCLRHTGQPFDAAGAWGAEGRVDPALLVQCLLEPYFTRTGIKSTGRDLFHAGWLDQQLMAHRHLSPQDVQATLVALTAATIADAVRAMGDKDRPVQEVLVCGGGAHNAALMAALAQDLPDSRITTTADHGWPVSQVEAAAFAWLARQALLGLPGNEPLVTGARGPRIMGAIYPA